MIRRPANPFAEVAGDVTTTPVGAIVPYAGQLYNPKGDGSATTETYNFWINQRLALRGWLVCDGRGLWIDKYFDLFRVIGTAYGGGSGQFKLPDYRAQFMRGQDLGKGTGGDPDVGERTGGAGGKDNVGSTQTGMVQKHEHYYSATSASATSDEGPIAAAPPAGNQPTTDLLDSAGTSSLTGKETRPVNIYVNYLIKYTADPAGIVAIGIDENPPTGASRGETAVDLQDPVIRRSS